MKGDYLMDYLLFLVVNVFEHLFGSVSRETKSPDPYLIKEYNYVDYFSQTNGYVDCCC